MNERRQTAEGGGAQGASAPTVSLPSGGGAVRGIGEKFTATPARYSASLTVPIATSPGRAGFGPQLSLAYDSGSGNGPFGVGWQLALPQITRRTDTGLPQYADAQESDVYILSGAEDLVPLLAPGGLRHEDATTAPGYVIHRYRPRIEGLFARIERWTNPADAADVHWRAISTDNILTVYGKNANSRIADPSDRTRIFAWLLCEVRDDQGNAVVYAHKAEDGAGADLTAPHERNRGDRTAVQRTANRYLKRILYGNRVPLLDAEGNRPRFLSDDDAANAGWMFEVVFDYGEHDAADPRPLDAGEWRHRQDALSSFRAGFEVRSCRLCRRVLNFHHFAEEAEVGADCLVRSMTFEYSEKPFGSFITAITQSGHKRAAAGGYITRSVPPLEFEYSESVVGHEIREVDRQSLENLPSGVDSTAYHWIDLDGEGLTGVLTQQGGGWFYKHNESALHRADTPAGVQVRFGPVEQVARIPVESTAGAWQFLDLAGDGQLDLVSLEKPLSGFFERTTDGNWTSFRPFDSVPNVAWNDPNLMFIDLTGDGQPDVLITEDDAVTWYPSLGENGFGQPSRVGLPVDEERRPLVVFADQTQVISVADLSGDGLTDLVRIRNGEVCYWPNLGYGRFGAKVTMTGSPWFDTADQFDPGRIRLADIDGSGTTDIIYLGRHGARFWFNESGNAWSGPRDLSGFPQLDDTASVAALDLLGNGTACLVWSSPLPGHSTAPMKYLELMARGKPHLLIRTSNNLGAETRIRYAPSTRFYLRDKLAGTPWITRLPFPVHVVERIETWDPTSRNRFVTRYAYHHGYFDGDEREFRGFGMVEQWDTEDSRTLTESDTLAADNIDASSHVPPVHTKTWFHVGAYFGRDRISRYFAGRFDDLDRGEYYREPGRSDAEADALLLDDTVLPSGLTGEEEREACRALKGSMLRQEVYGLDGSPRAPHPYSIVEQNFALRVIQRRGANANAVFLVHARESLTYHYERNPEDPRVAHVLTLEVDDFGNVLKQCSIAYGRRTPDLTLSPADRARQAQTLVTYSENAVTNAVDAAGSYRTPMPCEGRAYEISGLTLLPGRQRFNISEAQHAVATAPAIAYEAAPVTGLVQKRLIEHVRTLYRRDDLTGPLPLGELQPLALPFESYVLVLTSGLVSQVYEGRVSDAMLESEARYLHSDDDAHWWSRSGRMFYSPRREDTPAEELAQARAHFFLRRRYEDAFHTDAVNTARLVTYDAFDLLVLETIDALGNRVTAGERDVDPTQPLVRSGLDYRVLQPRLVMDPNRNRSAAAFDALGMVVGTAVMGKPLPAAVEGDSLDGFDADVDDAAVLDHLANPLANPAAILQRATTRLVYDLFAYFRTRNQPNPQPPVVYSLVRETHDSDPTTADGLRIQHRFSYSDGFGREIQKKVRGESGGASRWIGSGWTIFNNKGKPCRKYEPFFTDTHRFEFDPRVGVSPVTFYDTAERVVATLHPNQSWEKVVFDPWRKEAWDVNDTVLIADPSTDPDAGDFFRRLPAVEYLPTWFARREGGDLGAREQAAALRSAIHAATPVVTYSDALGRPFLTVARNTFKYLDASAAEAPAEQVISTRVVLDIEGNQREVVDALGRVVARYDYDLRGTRIRQAGMDTGQRWMLQDAAGAALYAWNDRNHTFRTAYDALRRPTDSFVREAAGREVPVVRTVYGETQADAETRNARGRVVQVFDQAGVATTETFDFKGNIVLSRRQFAQAYSTTLDWSSAVPLEPESFTSLTRYDALNRARELTAPDNSVIRPGYNATGLVMRVDVNLRGALQNGQPSGTSIVSNIDYDSKGQRTRIDYGNGVTTTYAYDPSTLRMTHLLTRRDAARFSDDCPDPAPPGWPGCQVQNLHYTYDAAGNVTHIHDQAQQTRFFANQRVEPSADYIYDAVYRLIEATGREHLGQVGGAPMAGSYNDRRRVGRLLSANDGAAMGRYLERYVYDVAGNVREMIHRGSEPAHPGWTRSYTYSEPSAIDVATVGNRLTSTTVDALAETYSAAGDGYDAHGNLLRMPHLQEMQTDFKEQLRMTRRQAIDDSDEDGVQRAGERTWYVYEASGQRVRKVTELANGQIKDERRYLNGFENYRKLGVSPLTRETLHVSAAGQRIALVQTRTQGSEPGVPAQTVRFQFGNHLGSATLELDEEAQIVSYEEYTPFGSTSLQAVRSQTETPKRYRFSGQERDEESGLYYVGARYYAPWLARWTHADPMGLVDGVNVYAYARNRPLVITDPTGTQSEREELPNQVLDALARVGVPSAEDDPEDGRSVLDDIGDFFSSLWDGIKNIASAVWEWTKGAVSTAWEWIKKAASTAWTWTKNAATAAWNWTKGAVATAWTWIKNAAVTAWNWTKRAASAAWNWTTKAARAAWDWLAGDDGFFEDAVEIIGHLTWGALGTTVGLLVTAFNLTIGNLITAIHNAFASDADDWDYGSISIGGPNDENDIIGNYGGLFNLGGLGAALTIGPFVFFQGSRAAARGETRYTATSIRDWFKQERAGAVYGSKQNLHVADHEEGHEDQYLLYGPFALFFGIIFSLVPNAVGAAESSGWFWFDRQANRWSGSNSPFNANAAVHP